MVAPYGLGVAWIGGDIFNFYYFSIRRDCRTRGLEAISCFTARVCLLSFRVRVRFSSRSLGFCYLAQGSESNLHRVDPSLWGSLILLGITWLAKIRPPCFWSFCMVFPFKEKIEKGNTIPLCAGMKAVCRAKSWIGGNTVKRLSVWRNMDVLYSKEILFCSTAYFGRLSRETINSMNWRYKALISPSGNVLTYLSQR